MIVLIRLLLARGYREPRTRWPVVVSFIHAETGRCSNRFRNNITQ